MTAAARGLLCAMVLSVAGRTVAAQRPIPDGIVRHGTLSFDGRATVGNFTGTTSEVSGEMSGSDSLQTVRGWVEAPVATLKTGNDRRDRDLRRSMEAEKYATIRFELAGVEPPAVVGDSMSARLRGRFIIHGVSREATVPVTLVFLPESVRVHGETQLNLEEYDIGGLTKMMGMLKMHEEIVVRIDLVFEAAG